MNINTVASIQQGLSQPTTFPNAPEEVNPNTKLTPELFKEAIGTRDTPPLFRTNNKVEKQNTEQHLKLANIFLKAKDFENASTFYEKAVGLDQNSLSQSDHENLLIAYKALGSKYYDYGAKEFHRLSELAQSSPDTYTAECTYLFNKSRDYFTKFIKLNGEKCTHDDYKLLGNACYNSKHYREALDYFNKSRKSFRTAGGLIEDMLKLYVKIAETSYQLNDYRSTIKWYENALEMDKSVLSRQDHQKLENSYRQYVDDCVASFLHPYITGQITRDNEPKGRDSLWVALRIYMPCKNPSKFDEIKEMAFQSYLKHAVLGLYVNQKLTSVTITTDSKKFGILVSALEESLPREFGMKLSTVEVVEHATKALNSVNEERFLQSEEARKYLMLGLLPKG